MKVPPQASGKQAVPWMCVALKDEVLLSASRDMGLYLWLPEQAGLQAFEIGSRGNLEKHGIVDSINPRAEWVWWGQRPIKGALKCLCRKLWRWSLPCNREPGILERPDTGTLQRETVWASSREGPRVCYKSQRLGSGDTCDHWSLYDSILRSSTPAWSFRGLHFPCCILIIFCYTCTSSWDRSVYSIPLCT